MPVPEPDLIVVPPVPSIGVALEPAHSALGSLVSLIKADKHSGFAEWVTRTAAALTPEQWHTHRLVMIGVHYAIVPDRSFSSFPAYVDHLAALDPVVLRNRVFNAYAQVSKHEELPDLPVALITFREGTWLPCIYRKSPFLQNLLGFLRILLLLKAS